MRRDGRFFVNPVVDRVQHDDGQEPPEQGDYRSEHSGEVQENVFGIGVASKADEAGADSDECADEDAVDRGVVVRADRGLEAPWCLDRSNPTPMKMARTNPIMEARR